MKNKICKISLFSALLASVSAMPVDARVNTNNSNRSYANAYNQVNAMRYQQEYMDAMAANATTASATANLPVAVADEKLATEILNNASETTIDDLDACSMIYPNGIFRWEIPESGVRREQKNQCVSVISLIDANTNAVLATTTVAAGDSMKCNIDSFPESGMNRAVVERTYLPADDKPTLEDVEAVMNEEQKQHAGLKIAAGAILSGVAGNLLSKKEVGDTKMFGASKTQLRDTAIGAVAGAGIMAASSYTGKVAGDTIKSTAVNAASGMVVGNMLAGASDDGDILRIQTCYVPSGMEVSSGDKDCIAGKISTVEAEGVIENGGSDGKKYIINRSGEIKECTGDGDEYICDSVAYGTYVDVKVQLNGMTGGIKEKPYKEVDANEYNNNAVIFIPSKDGETVRYKKTDSFENRDVAYYLINSAKKSKEGASKPAYIVFNNKIDARKIKSSDGNKGMFDGLDTDDFEKVKNSSAYIYVYRNSDGTVGSQIKEENIFFTPASGKASDGGLIDMSNQGRVKGTLVGTAAGGAMGGLAGYQGAKSEIQDRWTAAIREYEDSLSNFVCMTGTRFLSKYNDYVEIPEPKKSE